MLVEELHSGVQRLLVATHRKSVVCPWIEIDLQTHAVMLRNGTEPEHTVVELGTAPLLEQRSRTRNTSVIGDD